MTNSRKLHIIKSIHTLIWAFFNLVIFYLLYAVIAGKIDKWVGSAWDKSAWKQSYWHFFKKTCPITLIARRYSTSRLENFDIYLPNWLAKYNKLIYSSIVLLAVLLLIYQLIS